MAMSAFVEVAREWVQSAQVHSWLARVLEDLGGEHPVPALPSCGLCDALVLVLLESLQNLDTALCKNRGVAFHAWLYNLLGGAAEKLVSPPRFGNTARKSLLKAATTECNRFCKLAISRQRAEVRRATSAAALERTTATLNALMDLAGERRLIDALSARLRGDTAQRVVPARGGASAVGGGGGADETPPTEVVRLRRELAKMQAEKVEASAAMTRLELEHRGVVRELRQSQSHAGALERDFDVRLSTAHAVHEAEQLKSQQAHQKVQKAQRLRVKSLKQELRDEATEWSLYARRLKQEIVDAKRETVAELRGFYAAEHLVWQEAVERPQCSGSAATSSSSASIACATAGTASSGRRWMALSNSCGS